MGVVETQCTICCSDIDRRKCTKIPCGHQFCHSCIIPWLLCDSTCPNCRQPIGVDCETMMDGDVNEIVKYILKTKDPKLRDMFLFIFRTLVSEEGNQTYLKHLMPNTSCTRLRALRCRGMVEAFIKKNKTTKVWMRTLRSFTRGMTSDDRTIYLLGRWCNICCGIGAMQPQSFNMFRKLWKNYNHGKGMDLILPWQMIRDKLIDPKFSVQMSSLPLDIDSIIATNFEDEMCV